LSYNPKPVTMGTVPVHGLSLERVPTGVVSPNSL